MHHRLENISVFVEAVEAGGFSRAAERLGLSRSAVGKAVARLEERLDARLFNRTTRVLTLTEEGQIYYDKCRRALKELRSGEELLHAGRTDVVGKVRMSMPILFGCHCVTPILLELARQYPNLDLDLRFSDLLVDVIGEGFDLAIRQGPIADESGLRIRKICSQNKIICAAPSYFSERAKPQTIHDLEMHDALVYWRSNRLFPWQLRDLDGNLQNCKLKWRLQFDNLEAIVDAAVAGLGIAWLPDWLIRPHLNEGRLLSLLDGFPTTAVDTFAVWPETPTLPKRLRVIVDTLAEKLPGISQEDPMPH